MRITQNMSASNAIYNLQLGQTRLDNLQNMVASGQNVSQPSDDPISTKILLDIGDKLKAIDQHASNITKADSWLKYTSTALSGMSAIINQAKKVVGTINAGSSDPVTRQGAHDQLVDLKKQLIDMANIQYGDQYLFGGANNASAPFNTVTNAYAGDSTQLTVEIAQNTSQPISVTGDRLLQGIGTTPSYGAINILDTFDNLITAVGDSITTSDVPGISSASQALQDGSSQINIATSDVLSRMTRLSSMAKLNENNKNTLLTIATNIQNVDYAKLGVELANQKTAFEASLSTAAKLSQLSLLTYL